MINGDLSLTPMGSDREAGEDEAEAEREGEGICRVNDKPRLLHPSPLKNACSRIHRI
jgi:hypothetical protein